MKITLNGKPHELDKELSVPDFLKTLELGPQPVLVELNGVALFARELDQHTVKDGDEVEIVLMVAGG